MKSEAAYRALKAFARIETSSLYDVSLAIPGSASIFQKLGINLFGNRHKSLTDLKGVCGLRTGVISGVKELVRVIEKAATEPDILISYILTHFHDVHREEISELVCMANRVEFHHRYDPSVPGGLALLLDQLDELTEIHMQNEEPLFFAMMKQQERSFIRPSVTEMYLEHSEQEALVSDINTLTAGFCPPDDACDLWRTLYARVSRLCVELGDHNRLENEILFPCFVPRFPC